MGYDYTEYFEQLVERVGSAVTVPFREVVLENGEAKLNGCHANVNAWVSNHPGAKAVRGWWFWALPNEAGQYTFMAHSVVEEDGQLVDITPLDQTTTRRDLVFLKHLASEEEFSAIRATCSQVFYPPMTLDDCRASQLAAPEDAMA